METAAARLGGWRWLGVVPCVSFTAREGWWYWLVGGDRCQWWSLVVGVCCWCRVPHPIHGPHYKDILSAKPSTTSTWKHPRTGQQVLIRTNTGYSPIWLTRSSLTAPKSSDLLVNHVKMLSLNYQYSLR
jgi:hypothetical protein